MCGNCISSVVPLADGMNCGDIGEEMMVFGCSHSLPQSLTAFEMTHQDAQAVQVRVLRCHNLENGLHKYTDRYGLKKTETEMSRNDTL